MKKKRMTVDIPNIKHTEIKTLAASLGITITELVDKAVMDYIKRLKKK